MTLRISYMVLTRRYSNPIVVCCWRLRLPRHWKRTPNTTTCARSHPSFTRIHPQSPKRRIATTTIRCTTATAIPSTTGCRSSTTSIRSSTICRSTTIRCSTTTNCRTRFRRILPTTTVRSTTILLISCTIFEIIRMC